MMKGDIDLQLLIVCSMMLLSLHGNGWDQYLPSSNKA